MTETFALPVRVYIEDTDAGGIVYYVNYLKYMERARTDLLRSLGFAKDYVVNDDGLLVVAGLTVDYHRPAQLDDQLQVTAQPTALSAASIDFLQQVFRGDELLCTAQVKVVAVNRQTGKATRLPAPIREALVTALVS